MSDPVRVLVVDDSAFARKVLREVLAGHAGVEVVGTARDGLEALEAIAHLAPDVVTLDLVMPQLDGVGVLRELAPLPHAPAVVVVTTSAEESELAVEALALGAFDLVRKPTNLATDRLYELGGELVAKVLAAGARSRGAPAAAAAPAPVRRPQRPASAHLVVIGTSTGGPQALGRLVPALPPDLPPVVIALHIPAEYTGPMAARLDRASPAQVVEGRDGQELLPGLVVLAPGGHDLEVRREAGRLVARIVERRERIYHPSVDALLESAARACGPDVLAAVLTGMGNDGLAGARAVRAAGGRVVVEAASSAVVDGMPGAVRRAGLADDDLPLDRFAAGLLRHLGRERAR